MKQLTDAQKKVIAPYAKKVIELRYQLDEAERTLNSLLMMSDTDEATLNLQTLDLEYPNGLTVLSSEESEPQSTILREPGEQDRNKWLVPEEHDSPSK